MHKCCEGPACTRLKDYICLRQLFTEASYSSLCSVTLRFRDHWGGDSK